MPALESARAESERERPKKKSNNNSYSSLIWIKHSFLMHVVGVFFLLSFLWKEKTASANNGAKWNFNLGVIARRIALICMHFLIMHLFLLVQLETLIFILIGVSSLFTPRRQALSVLIWRRHFHFICICFAVLCRFCLAHNIFDLKSRTSRTTTEPGNTDSSMRCRCVQLPHVFVRMCAYRCASVFWRLLSRILM